MVRLHSTEHSQRGGLAPLSAIGARLGSMREHGMLLLHLLLLEMVGSDVGPTQKLRFRNRQAKKKRQKVKRKVKERSPELSLPSDPAER